MTRTLVFALLLAGCGVVQGPDPREGFTERNVGRTLVTHVEGLGTQAVYLEPGGGLWVWSAAGPGVRRGSWRYDLLATGAATTYQGAAGINHPVEELATAWGICLQFRDEAGNVLRRQGGGDWNCALLPDYEALVVARAEGDAFGLADGEPPARMPEGALLGLEELRDL